MNRTLTCLLAAGVLSAGARANLVIPGANGSDGALTVTTSTVIDLSQAPSGAWDANSPTPGKGVYDPAKWAVVFHYTSVNIATAASVTFTNHASRAPVVWLVNGDVTINGAVHLDGANQIGGIAGDAGPGGFRGGFNAFAPLPQSGGFGPGGGYTMYGNGNYSNAALGLQSGSPYGNSQILPLIGGSGAGGIYGGGGGGAILIAATGAIHVNGSISANGGSLAAGGAIRLICGSYVGGGSLLATGSSSKGRIRIESPSVDIALLADPVTYPVLPDNPVKLWLAATDSSVRVVSVGSAAVPADPLAAFNYTATDISFTNAGTLAVVIETKNILTDSIVNLRVSPKAGNATLIPATFTSGDVSTATWTAQVAVPLGIAAMQVRVEPHS